MLAAGPAILAVILALPLQARADDGASAASRAALALVAPAIIAPFCGQRGADWGHRVQQAAVDAARSKGTNPVVAFGLVQGQVDALVWEVGVVDTRAICAAATGPIWAGLMAGADRAAR